MNELENNYQTAGFCGSLELGNRPALVLIDLARAYIDSSSPLYLGDESAFLANIELTKAARDAGIPVIFTRVEYMSGGGDGGLFYKKVAALSLFQKGEPMAEFDRRLRPEAEDIIVTKQYPSAFFGTSLAATLTAMGVNSCIISGFSTSGCVRASALDALQNGFVPIVVSDACGDRDPAVQQANLFDLGAKYAEVMSLEAAKSYLSSI